MRRRVRLRRATQRWRSGGLRTPFSRGSAIPGEAELPRFCRETRSQLPALAAGELSGWSRRVVRAHLKRCTECAAEQQRQEEVSAALAQLKHAPPTPPPDLLDNLLERAGRRGVRERAAVPARGAVSGARPGLSIAFLTVGAAASTGIGYGVYRGVRAARNLRRH